MKTKKILVSLLAASMMFGMASMAALADEEVTTAEALQTAVDAGGTVKLDDDISLDTYMLIQNTVTLDLNGHTISFNDPDYGKALFVYGGNLTIQDSDSNGILNGYVYAFNGSSVTLNSGKITGDENYGIYADDTSAVTMNGGAIDGVNWGIALFGEASLTMTNGTINSNDFAVTTNGAYTTNSQITISGGTLTSTGDDGAAIYHPGVGTMNISGGTFTGSSGIEVRSGSVNITGGSFIATGSYSVNANGNGSTTTAAAIAVAQHTTDKDISVNVRDAELTGVEALSITNPQGRTSDKSITVRLNNVTCNGGVICEDSRAELTITNGTISTENIGVVLTEASSATINGTEITADNGIGLWDSASVTVSGATIYADTFGVFNNGNSANTTINISNSEITSVSEDAIFNAGSGTVTVTGSVLNGSTGIEMRAGTANITNTAITSTEPSYTVIPSNNGNTTNGAALAVAQHSTQLPITVNIGAGTSLNCNSNGKAISITNKDGRTASETIAVNITGGTVNGDIVKTDDRETTELNITGGIYDRDVKEYVASGYSELVNNDTYKVIPNNRRLLVSGTVKSAVEDGKYSQTTFKTEDLTGVSRITYTVNIGGQEYTKSYDYENINGNVAFGLIIGGIPEDVDNVTITSTVE